MEKINDLPSKSHIKKYSHRYDCQTNTFTDLLHGRLCIPNILRMLKFIKILNLNKE